MAWIGHGYGHTPFGTGFTNCTIRTMADIPEADRPASTMDYYENNTSKFSRKVRENPSVFLGVLGMIGMVGYGAYNFRKRGNMRVSVYLMHLRVKAQAMVVGSMAIGVGYTLIKDYFKERREHAETELDKLH